MKVFNLFTIAATSLLVLVGPASAHVLPLHNAISTSSDDTVSNDNSTTDGNSNNSTQVSTDLGKFNGTWYTISMEEDIYKEMQKMAKKYNTTCSCPQLTLTPAGPAALNANASCLLQTNGSSTQILSRGLLTLLPDRRATKSNNKTKDHRATTNGNQTSSISQEYYFALLFSRLYIDSDDANLDHRGNQSDHLPNLHHQGVQLPHVDSGVKGSLYWSFFSSKNGSSPDDVAFVRTKHMISGDNKHDVPDVNIVVSKSQDLFDDAAYNETASSIPGLGNDYKWDYVKLDKCNATSDGAQPSETSGGGNPEATSSATSDQQPQTTSSSTQQGGEGQGQQPTETTDGGDQQQPQPTETNTGGDQQQPQATETSGGGDQQQPQPTETNNAGGDQQQPQSTETSNGGGGDQQQSNGGDGQ